MAMKLASAAPVTPSFGNGPTPKISKGASMMLSRTLSTCNPTVGLMIPVARNAEPNATSGNCNNSAGMNQSRYFLARVAVIASALNELLYTSINRNPKTPRASATRMDMTNDWLKTSSARV